MKHGLTMFTVHAGITYTTEDGWEGSRTGEIPTFAVIGGTAGDAEANAARLFGMPVGTRYTLPGEKERTITGVSFTAYPTDVSVSQLTPEVINALAVEAHTVGPDAVWSLIESLSPRMLAHVLDLNCVDVEGREQVSGRKWQNLLASEWGVAAR